MALLGSQGSRGTACSLSTPGRLSMNALAVGLRPSADLPKPTASPLRLVIISSFKFIPWMEFVRPPPRRKSVHIFRLNKFPTIIPIFISPVFNIYFFGKDSFPLHRQVHQSFVVSAVWFWEHWGRPTGRHHGQGIRAENQSENR